MKILHLSPHLGGGVGTVVLSYLEHVTQSSDDIHKIICFDYINTNAQDRLGIAEVEFKEELRFYHAEVLSQISNSDVVIVHWWNHPLLYEFFLKATLPPCRLIIWAHISGTPAPNCFTEKIFNYPDLFVFTTPLSFYDPVYQSLCDSSKKKVRVIWSTGGVERLEKYNTTKSVNDNLQVGYIGNLDFTKLHPNFVKICDSIPLNNVRYVVIGPENKLLTSLVEKSLSKTNYHLTGYISEKEKYQHLNNFTCFGYPLARHHYGTCDQTIQEAMALGVVPVVLSNPMESYMVEHGKTGLVAKTIDSYKNYVIEVCNNKNLRISLANNAQEFAKKQYSISNLVNNWNQMFIEVLGIPKNVKKWSLDSENIQPIQGHNIFIESLGSHSGVFKDYLNDNGHLKKHLSHAQICTLSNYHQWVSESKSTVHQYLTFFPSDEILQAWSKMMKNNNL